MTDRQIRRWEEAPAGLFKIPDTGCATKCRVITTRNYAVKGMMLGLKWQSQMTITGWCAGKASVKDMEPLPQQ